MNGSSRHLGQFDRLREDDGYVRTIESGETLSSHAVKRLFGSFGWPRIYLFRRLFQKLFLWRLHLEKPQVIVIGVDVVVFVNDDAPRRHGVKPTYKKVKGFAPLQINRGRFVIDAVFRSGDKHSNHSIRSQRWSSMLCARSAGTTGKMSLSCFAPIPAISTKSSSKDLESAISVRENS